MSQHTSDPIDEFEEYRARSYSGGISLLKRNKHSTRHKTERSHSLKHDDLDFMQDKRHEFSPPKGKHDQKYQSEPHVRFVVRPKARQHRFVEDRPVLSDEVRRLSLAEHYSLDIVERQRLSSMPSHGSADVVRMRSFSISHHGTLDKGPVYMKHPITEKECDAQEPVSAEHRRAQFKRIKKTEAQDMKRYHVGMFGLVGVGKHTILHAFKAENKPYSSTGESV